jgi:hypothetical protein
MLFFKIFLELCYLKKSAKIKKKKELSIQVARMKKLTCMIIKLPHKCCLAFHYMIIVMIMTPLYISSQTRFNFIF